MNQRIRELAEQAGEYVNEVYTPPVRSKTPGKIWEDGHIEWHTQFNQKFAELIFGNVESIWNQRLKDCMLYPHKNLIQTFNQTLKFVPKSVMIIFKD